MLGSSDYRPYGPIHYASFYPELMKKIFGMMKVIKLNVISPNEYSNDDKIMTFRNLVEFCVEYNNIKGLKFVSEKSKMLFDCCPFCHIKGQLYKKYGNFFQNLYDRYHKKMHKNTMK